MKNHSFALKLQQAVIDTKLVVIPLIAGVKQPKVKYMNEQWTTAHVVGNELIWDGPCDFGMLVYDDIVVIDFDSHEAFDRFPPGLIPAGTVSENTKRGKHFWFLSTEHSRKLFPIKVPVTTGEIDYITITGTGTPHLVAVAPSPPRTWVLAPSRGGFKPIPDALVDELYARWLEEKAAGAGAEAGAAATAAGATAATAAGAAARPAKRFKPLTGAVDGDERLFTALGLKVTSCESVPGGAWGKVACCPWPGCGLEHKANSLVSVDPQTEDLCFVRKSGTAHGPGSLWLPIVDVASLGGPLVVDSGVFSSEYRVFNPFKRSGGPMRNEVVDPVWMEPRDTAGALDPAPWLEATVIKRALGIEDLRFHGEDRSRWFFKSVSARCPVCGKAHTDVLTVHSYSMILEGVCGSKTFKRRFSATPADFSSIIEAASWEDKCDAARAIIGASKLNGVYDRERKYVFRSIGCDPAFYVEQLKATIFKETGVREYHKVRLETLQPPPAEGFVFVCQG